MALKRLKVYTEGLSEKDRKSAIKIVSKLLAEYPDFILAEVDEKGVKALEDRGVRSEEQPGSPMVRLKTVDIDTSAKAPASPPSLKLKDADVKSGGDNYWIIQFIGPAIQQWSEEIKKAGGSIKGYIPENAFLVRMSPEEKNKVAQFPFVNWIGLYEPVYKISPTLMGRKGRAAHKDIKNLSLKAEAVKPTPMGNINVQVHD